MQQAAAFVKDKTALFKEESHTQANRLGAEITLVLLLFLLIALPHPQLHTSPQTHTHAPPLPAGSQQGRG